MVINKKTILYIWKLKKNKNKKLLITYNIFFNTTEKLVLLFIIIDKNKSKKVNINLKSTNNYIIKVLELIFNKIFLYFLYIF